MVSFTFQEVPDYASLLVSLDFLDSKPLKGLKIGVIQETLGDGVDGGVISSVRSAASHLEQLGALVTEVAYFFSSSFPSHNESNLNY